MDCCIKNKLFITYYERLILERYFFLKTYVFKRGGLVMRFNDYERNRMRDNYLDFVAS